MSDAVVFKNVDIIFGKNPQLAVQMVDQGKTRDEIGAATGLVLGVAGASLTINEGEILVLMGLSGSGKSTLLRAVNGLAPVVRGEVEVKTANGSLNPYRCNAKSLRDFRMHTSRWCSSSLRFCRGERWRTMSGSGSNWPALPMPNEESESASSLNSSTWPNGRTARSTSSRAACSSGSVSQEPLPPAPRSC